MAAARKSPRIVEPPSDERWDMRRLAVRVGLGMAVSMVIVIATIHLGLPQAWNRALSLGTMLTIIFAPVHGRNVPGYRAKNAAQWGLMLALNVGGLAAMGTWLGS